LAIAILRYGLSIDVLHHEVRAALTGRARVEDLGDVRVVHHRERLALVVKAGEHLAGVHAELHNLEGHTPANGFTLLGQVNRAHTAFAQGTDDSVAAEVIILRRGRGEANGLGPELAGAGT